LVTIDEYLKGILAQILASYKILTELSDNPPDLEIIKKELSKIRGLLQVMRSKLDKKKYQSDHLVTLQKLSAYYIDTYDFTREIEMLKTFEAVMAAPKAVNTRRYQIFGFVSS